MTGLTRRGMVTGLLALGVPAWAEAPASSPRPPKRPAPGQDREAARLLQAAKLGGITGWAVADVATGKLIETHEAEAPVPPASVAKAITAMFALERLGPDHRFRTRVLTTGPVVNGRLDGDLILSGGGDPTLDTDDLGDLAAAVAAAGLTSVSGRFLVHDAELPAHDRIAADQPDHVGYNPAFGGLNLNFNRVHFEWRQKGAGDWTVAMDARGERFVPPVRMARVRVARREVPLFSYEPEAAVEGWSVASSALGKEGSRWLPVRRPTVYVAEVFQTLLAAQGIALPAGERVEIVPQAATELAAWESEPLTDILRGMLRFSTNITAECVGMTASGAGTLAGSGRAMTEWARTALGVPLALVDHSGLGAASRVTPGTMVHALLAGDRIGQGLALRGILRDIGMRDDQGKAVKDHPVRVLAKSGTLNFVSGLAGFIARPGGRELAFCIYSADLPRRAALPIDEREEPPGGPEWTRRARRLQGQLIARWADRFA